MNYTFFTVIVSAAAFPNAEVCVMLLQKCYPKIKVILAFDFSKHYSETRKQFFTEKGVKVIQNAFSDRASSYSHGRQLDRLAQIVRTPYFITMDDDAFMKKRGVIEACIPFLKDGVKYLGPQEGRRFHPFFSVVNTRFFRENHLSFSPPGDTDGAWLDTAAYLYLACTQKGIRHHKINDFVHGYVDHMSAMTGKLDNLMDLCKPGFTFSEIKTKFEVYNRYLLLADKAGSGFKRLDDVEEKDFGFLQL